MEKFIANVNKENRKKLNKKLIILALVLVMIATTAASYVFWSSSVSDADGNYDLTVTVGTGNELLTELNLTTPGGSQAGNLIPHDITPNPEEGETNQLTYTVNAVWAEGDNETDGDLDDVDGVLTVSAVSITAGETELVDADLFNVSFDSASYAIVGNNTNGVNVGVTVTMNQPADRAQYDLIAGQNLTLTLKFAVTPANS